jgi:biotin transport system substrate-specific component
MGAERAEFLAGSENDLGPTPTWSDCLMERTATATLAQTWLPREGLQYDALRVLAGSLFVALCAQVAIYLPFTPVPITGQTFGVALTGALLGSRLGVLALVAYLAEGIVGLPVFAGGASAWIPSRLAGVPYIFGHTSGYLVGFVLAAFLIGWLAERGWDRKVWTLVLALALGDLVIHICGLARLSALMPVQDLLPLALLPFLPGDATKIALATTALRSAWFVTDRVERR